MQGLKREYVRTERCMISRMTFSIGSLKGNAIVCKPSSFLISVITVDVFMRHHPFTMCMHGVFSLNIAYDCSDVNGLLNDLEPEVRIES